MSLFQEMTPRKKNNKQINEQEEVTEKEISTN